MVVTDTFLARVIADLQKLSAAGPQKNQRILESVFNIYVPQEQREDGSENEFTIQRC